MDKLKAILALLIIASPIFAATKPAAYDDVNQLLVTITNSGANTQSVYLATLPVGTLNVSNLVVDGNTYNIPERDGASLDPTGFEDPENTHVLYDSTARTITITNSSGISVWWRGTNLNFGTSWTSDAHTNTVGLHYLAMRDTTNFVWDTQPWTFDMAQAAIAYYNPGQSWAIHETHGMVMDHHTHEELHLNIGTYVNEGIEVVTGSYVLQDGGNNTNVTPRFSAGAIHDEDNHTDIAATETGRYTRVFFAPNGTSQITTNNNYMVQVTGTYPDINTWNGSVFATNEASANQFFNLWVGVAPMANDDASQEYRVFVVQPQKIHTSLASAQAETTANLNMSGFAIIGPEYVFRYKITGRTSASYSTVGKWRIEALELLTGNERSQISISGATAVNTADAIQTDVSAFNNILSSADTTVQKALDTIDNGAFTNGLSPSTWSYYPAVSNVNFGGLSATNADEIAGSNVYAKVFFRSGSASDISDRSGVMRGSVYGTTTSTDTNHAFIGHASGFGLDILWNYYRNNSGGVLWSPIGINGYTNIAGMRFDNTGISFYSKPSFTNNSATPTADVKISTTGFVGINDTTPSYHLDVNGTGAFNYVAIRGSNLLEAIGDGGLGDSAYTAYGNQRAYVGYRAGGDLALQGRGGKGITLHVNEDVFGSNEVMRIETTGFVGINDTTPSYHLDVNGNAQVQSNLYVTGNVGLGTTSPSEMLHVVNGSILLGSNTAVAGVTQRLSLGGSYGTSTAGATNNLKLATFLSSAGAYGFGISSALFEYQAPAAANHAWFVGGSEKMRIEASGEVGIGTASPSYKLDVSGTARFTGKITATGGVDPPYSHLWEATLSAVTNRVAHEVPPSKYKGVVNAYIEELDSMYWWQPSSGKWLRLNMANGAMTKGMVAAWTNNMAPFEWTDDYFLDTATGELIKDQIPLNPPRWGLKQGYSLDNTTGIFYDSASNIVEKAEAVELIEPAAPVEPSNQLP